MRERVSENLPIGWVLATTEDLVGRDGIFCDGDWVESKDQDPSGDVRLIQLADLGDGAYLNRSARFLTSDKARQLRCTFLEPADVLIARMPDPLGRACLFPGDRKRSVTVVDVAVVRTGRSGADHRWLMWFINSPVFRRAVADLQSGSTRKRISRRNLASITLPVPPLAEQCRIADAVEAELSRLDAGVKALRRVQANLKRYRASVLKAACEGRLVPTEAELARQDGRAYEPADVLLDRILAERRARWEADSEVDGRTGRTRAYNDPAQPVADLLPQLPSGWRWAFLSTIAELKGGITKGQKARPGDRPRHVPYLRVANVQRGYLDLREVKEIVAPEATIEQLRLVPGDVLFNEGGDRDKLGRGWVWQGEIPECIHQNHVFRARLYTNDVHPKFLSWYGNSLAQRYFMEEGKQTTNLASINLTKLGALPVPIPPRQEQQRIVDEVDRRLSALDSLQAAVDLDLRRADRLRQSILKRAFEGKLVPQDPSDEPASALLERIRAERAAAERPARRRGLTRQSS